MDELLPIENIIPLWHSQNLRKPKARLEAVPHATLSIKAKQMQVKK